MGEKVVVTGGAGFLGSHVAERLARRYDVVVLDNLARGSPSNLTAAGDAVEPIRGDGRDPRVLPGLPQEGLRRTLASFDRVPRRRATG